MKTKNFLSVMLMLTVMIYFSVNTVHAQAKPKPWPVPEKSSKLANPVKSDAASLSTGKAVWSKHCASCHGKTGLGDGTKAKQLDTEAGNMTTAEFQKQPDGDLYYKTVEGRDDMPSFKKKIPDQEELWSVVNFMRTLKK